MGATVVLIRVGREALEPGELLRHMKLSAEDIRGLVIDQATGSPAGAIVQEAAARHTLLIVMSVDEQPAGPLHAFGHVIRDVLRAAPCPIVLVHSIPGGHPWALRQLILPHDGTPTSAAAIAPTADLASRAGADLVILHVATLGAERPAELGTFAAPRYLDQPQHEWPAWSQEFLERVRSLGHLTNIDKIRLVLAQGEASAAILEFARRNASDLIALAWRGSLALDRAQTMRRVICRRQLPRDHFPRAGVIMAPERIDLRNVEAFLFDLDGVVTRTARVHAVAWKQLFDDYLERRARAEGAAFVPFDLISDYRDYVDGRPREAGVRSFLAARRGISLPPGSPNDGPEAETLNGLGNRKDQYFIQALAQHGVEVYEGTVSFVRDARTRGVRTAIVSSSQNCAAVLDAAGLTQLFDIRVDGIDLRRLGFAGKPAPDMFLEAARRLKVPLDRAIVFEDAVVGVEAGRAGRFRLVVGIGQGDHAASLRAHGADIVVADLRELSLEQQWARP